MTDKDIERIEKMLHSRDKWLLDPVDERALTVAQLADEVPKLLREAKLWKAALLHATRCPLFQDVASLLANEPEKLTACNDCRDALILLRDSRQK